MHKRLLGCLGIVLLGAGFLQAAKPETADADSASVSQYRSILDHYCITCHNEKLHTAELVLSKVDVADPGGAPQVWEKVIRKLRTRGMPPSGAPRPDSFSWPTTVGTTLRARSHGRICSACTSTTT